MSGTQQAEAEAGAPPVDRAEIEARATRMGWRPRESYRGPPDKWVDADEYVERGERMMPLLQERNRTLDRTVQSLQTQLSEQGQTLATIVASTRRAEEAGYRRAKRELEERRARAVAAGDTQEFAAVQREIDELPAPEAPPPKTTPAPNGGANPAPAQNPVVAAWVARNRWFNASKAANSWAIGMMADLEAEDPTATIEENLAEVSRRAKNVFPELFPAPRRTAPPPEETEEEQEQRQERRANTRREAAPLVSASSSAPPRRPGPRSFEAMPLEVRREFDRQVKMMDGKGEPLTKEEFARYYWEAEGE